MHSAAHQIPGEAHRPGIDISHGEHSAAQQRGDLERIDSVVLGFAPMDGVIKYDPVFYPSGQLKLFKIIPYDFVM